MIDQILASARAEVRSARRLVRTWMFTVVAMLIGILGYGQQVFFHTIGSGISTTVGGMMTPRFVVSQLGAQILWVLMVALIFLAFDVRARDRRERMHEVLDARPVDNFSALLGRLMGLIVIGWLPLAVLALFILGLTALANGAGWWINPGVEPWSMTALLLIDAPVNLALWGAFVLLLAVVVRNRLVVALIALALFGTYVFAFFRVPIYLSWTMAAVGDPVALPSDLAPIFLSWQAVLHRLCYVAAAVGLLALAAVFHPRPDSAGRVPRLFAGAALTALGAVGFASLTVSAIADRQERDAWAAVHDEARDLPRADLQTLGGRVTIDPGDRLLLDIEATLVAPATGSGPLVFSLNPGLVITDLEVDEAKVEFTHEAGLLSIPRPASGNEPFTLTLRADGLPDPDFAYLDAAFDPMTMQAVEAGATLLLGTVAALFHDDYAALMPGIRWLPMPGAHVGQDDPDRGRDFFSVDLEVEVPSGWLVAGPGKAHDVGEDEDTARVRFNPDAPMTDFGVFAAPFERFATEVNGVTLEMLVSPKHADNLRFFADAADELEKRFAELLDGAAEVGLPYPYDGFSMVELPMGVRSFGGGWQMDTTLALPGIMLMPEAGLPLAEYGFHVRDRERLEAQEGGLAKAKVDTLMGSLQNDFGGGNPFLGVTRSFFIYQTGATGVGAAALNAMLARLANRLITNREGYFSAHGLQAQLQNAMGGVMLSMFQGQTNATMTTIRNAATNRPAVWERALGEALAELDVETDPELALNVVALKTTAVCRAVLGTLGREGAGALLAELRRRYAGTNFTAQEFEELAAELGTDLRPIVGDWLFETALPGYVTSGVRAYRIPDSDTGQPRYQVLVDVRNDEPTPGIFWLVSTLSSDQEQVRGTGPLRIEPDTSLEVGVVTAAKPLELRLGFDMALNRQPLLLALPTIDDEEITDGEPFTGARPSAWMPRAKDGIVIDDLDPGFTVEYDEGAGPVVGGAGAGFAIAVGAIASPDLDEGLPQFSPFTRAGGTWSRQPHPGAWGKYRHTVARAGITRANARAVFATELPRTGRWRLEYHMPQQGAGRSSRFSGPGIQVQINQGGTRIGDQGAYDMALVMGDDEVAIEFDGSVAGGGWNRLGEFDIADRQVRVVVANLAETGDSVIADAVRWSPVEDR